MTVSGFGADQALRILVVEDVAMLRTFLEDSLREEGLMVTAAESADQALLLLQQGLTVDILLCDIKMAGCLDGLELCRWVRRGYPQTVIVVQTAFAGPNTKNFSVLEKPYSPADLLDRLWREIDELRRRRWMAAKQQAATR